MVDYMKERLNVYRCKCKVENYETELACLIFCKEENCENGKCCECKRIVARLNEGGGFANIYIK